MKNTRQILLIEDSKSDAVRIIHILTASDPTMRVDQIETGEELRDALKHGKWDAIISDYHLPDFSAPAALEMLKETGIDIPFIVVSGTVGEETAVQLMKAGAHDYLMKDNLTRLVPVVEREIRDAEIRAQRREVEKQLAKERELFQALLDHSPDRVYFKDLQSRFVRVSKSQAESFNLSNPGDAIGKTDADFFTAEHALPARRDEEQIIRTGIPIIGLEEKETWADGKFCWVNTTKLPYYDTNGKIIGTFGISRDITLQKMATQMLQESHEFFQATLDSISANLCVLDEQGTIILINKGWKDFADANPPVPFEYCVGMNYLAVCDEAAGENSEEAAIMAYEIRRIINHQTSHYMMEYPCHSPSDEKRWFSVRVSGFYWKGQMKVVVSHFDITQRKLTEEQFNLRSAALEVVANSVLITDRNGLIEWANNSFYTLSGYSPKEIIGKPPDFMQSARNSQTIKQEILACIHSGKVWQGELLSTKKSGEEFTEEVSITPLKDQNGEIAFHIAIIQDITIRKNSELALLEEKEKYRSLYESIPIGVFRTSREGRILLANPTFIQMLGYETMDDLSEIDLARDVYTSPSERQNYLNRIEAEGRVKGFETVFRRKGGKRINVRIDGRRVNQQGAETQYYEGVIEDITDYTKSQLQNLRLVAAIENATEAILITDFAGIIQYANPAFEQIFIKDRNSVLGKNIRQVIHWKKGEDFWERPMTGMDKEKPLRRDFTVQLSDGTEKVLDINVTPTAGSSAELFSLVYGMREVTQERLMEIQRHQSQKMEAIGQLAAGIAHEINTPTQFIGNNLHFLQNVFNDLTQVVKAYDQCMQTTEIENLTEKKEKIRSITEGIDLDFLLSEAPSAIEGSIAGIDRVTRIVNAMKEFSHPGTHEKTITNINHAIDNTIIVSRNEWKYVAEVETDFDPNLPDLRCLVDEFNQVILNLIKNAADAIRDAKEKNASSVMGKIRIKTSQQGKWVVIQVSDNGPGIPDQIQDKVFDPFFTTKEVGKGTGQGLSISYDVIVNKHHGKISFESTIEKGTTFFIYLPVEGDLTEF
jgi:PAS domain S-box-containing protein